MDNDSVIVPISLEVTDISMENVNVNEVGKQVSQQLSGMLKSVQGIFSSLDASKINKPIATAMNGVTSSFQKAFKAQQAYDKALATAGANTQAYKNALQEQERIQSRLAQVKSEMSLYEDPNGNFDTKNAQFAQRYLDLIRERDALMRQTATVNPADYAEFAKIEGNTKDVENMATQYDQLTMAIQGTNRAAAEFNSTMDKNKYSDTYAAKLKEMAGLERKSQGLTDRAGRMEATGASGRAWANLKAEAAQVQARVQVLRAEMEELVQTGQAFRFGNGDAQAELDAIASRAGTIVDDLSGIQSKGNDVATSFISIGKAAGKFSSKAKGAIHGVIASLKKLTHQSRKSTSDMSKSLRRLWKNFLTFVLGFRSAYFLVKKLRTTTFDALKELAKVMPEVNTQISSIMTSMNMLKGSTATAFQPILELIARLLANIAAAANAAANAVARFFAQLRGLTSFYKFTAATEDYAKNAKKAGGAADDLKRSLMGFDEINRLDDNDSGGGGGAEDSIGTWEPTEFEPSAFVTMLKEAWQKADFTAVGKIMAVKLAGALNKAADWFQNSYGPFMLKLANSLATGINGFTGADTGLSNAIGNFIGNAINNSVNAIDKFLTTTDWSQVGSFLAESVMNTFGRIDWEKIAETFADYLRSMFTLAWSFLSNLDFEEMGDKVGKSINTFFTRMSEIDADTGMNGWQTLGATISEALGGIMEFIIKALDTVDWQEIGQAIGDFINSIEWDRIVFDFAGLVAKLVSGIAKAIAEWSKTAPLSAALTALFGTAIVGADIVSAAAKVIALIQKLKMLNLDLAKVMGAAQKASGIMLVVSGAFMAISSFVDQLRNGFSWAKEILLILGAGLATIGAILLGAPAAIALAVAAIGIAVMTLIVLIKDKWNEIVAWLKNAWKSIVAWFSNAWTAVTTAITNAAKWVANLFVTIGTGIKNAVVTAWNAIVSYIQFIINWWVTAFNNMLNWISTTWTNVWTAVTTFFTNLWNGVITFISNALNWCVTAFNNALTWIQNLWNTVWTAVSTFFVNTWNSIVTWVQTAIANVQTAIATVLTWIVTTWNTVWTSISTFFSNVWNGIVSTVQSAITWVSTTIATVSTAIQNTWNNAMTAISNFTTNIWNTITNTVKNAVNGVIGFINKMLTGVTNGLNTVINSANSLNFNIPNWVPVVGGSHFGLSIPTITAPQIPYLAQGAVIPPNNEFLAMLGDQSSGTNVEAPLATIQQAVAEVMADYIDGMMAGFQAVVEAIDNKDMEVNIGDNAIGRAAARYNRKQNLVRG